MRYRNVVFKKLPAKLIDGVLLDKRLKICYNV